MHRENAKIEIRIGTNDLTDKTEITIWVYEGYNIWMAGKAFLKSETVQIRKDSKSFVIVGDSPSNHYLRFECNAIEYVKTTHESIEGGAE